MRYLANFRSEYWAQTMFVLEAGFVSAGWDGLAVDSPRCPRNEGEPLFVLHPTALEKRSAKLVSPYITPK